MQEDTRNATEEPKNKKTEEQNDLQKKSDEYLNNWKRTAADFANYKKGEIERASLITKYAKEDMLYSILPVLDSIFLLDKHAKVEGIDMIKKQISEFLKQQGIEEIKAEGQKFDHNTMEVVTASADSSGESTEEMVVEELQKGYIMDGKVLRPARVKVGK